jgi:hypothetical protein
MPRSTLTDSRHLGQLSVIDPSQKLFCGLRASPRNDTESPPVSLGADLADLVSLTPSNRPFSEISTKLALLWTDADQVSVSWPGTLEWLAIVPQYRCARGAPRERNRHHRESWCRDDSRFNNSKPRADLLVQESGSDRTFTKNAVECVTKGCKKVWSRRSPSNHQSISPRSTTLRAEAGT